MIFKNVLAYFTKLSSHYDAEHLSMEVYVFIIII